MMRTVRIDIKPRHRNSPRPAWKVADSYRKWLRGRPCAFASAECAGKIEAAHTPDPGSKAMGSKAADHNCIPACQHHHALQTVKGWSAVGLNRDTAMEMARLYWRAWPGRIQWERERGA